MTEALRNVEASHTAEQERENIYVLYYMLNIKEHLATNLVTFAADLMYVLSCGCASLVQCLWGRSAACSVDQSAARRMRE